MDELKTVHTLLFELVQAFDFKPEDLQPLETRFPNVRFEHHQSKDSLLASLSEMELLLSWEFEQDWYSNAPNLKAVFTPAAGGDWVAEDPEGRVHVHYGTFHGPLLAESLLGAILYLNRKIPQLLINEKSRIWDRNVQAGTHSLARQTVLLVGYGSIGQHCARLLNACGAKVLGYRRSVRTGRDEETGAIYIPEEGLSQAISEADHLVLLLPGGADTDGFMSAELLARMKRGSYIYNFGRGNALRERDLLPFIESGEIAGAVLDVVEEEPLPSRSKLWEHPQVLVMPHSSCVYSDYKSMYINELEKTLGPYLNQGAN